MKAIRFAVLLLMDDLSTLKAKDIMSPSPKKISGSALAAEALELMRQNNINQLLVVDNECYSGIIHIQDLIREGII